MWWQATTATETKQPTPGAPKPVLHEKKQFKKEKAKKKTIQKKKSKKKKHCLARTLLHEQIEMYRRRPAATTSRPFRMWGARPPLLMKPECIMYKCF